MYTFVNTGAQRIVFIYKPGDVFPLTTYLSGSNIARFFYETIAPVEVKMLHSKQLEKKLQDNLDMGELLIEYTTTIDQQFIKRVNDMVSNTSPLDKVITLLSFLMNKFGTGKEEVHIDLPVTLKDIANMCGLEREEAAKQLVLLKDNGVTCHSHSFVINASQLKKFKQKT